MYKKSNVKEWNRNRDSDNDSYHSDSEFYYPDEVDILREDKNYGNRSEPNNPEDEEMSTI